MFKLQVTSKGNPLIFMRQHNERERRSQRPTRSEPCKGSERRNDTIFVYLFYYFRFCSFFFYSYFYVQKYSPAGKMERWREIDFIFCSTINLKWPRGLFDGTPRDRPEEKHFNAHRQQQQQQSGNIISTKPISSRLIRHTHTTIRVHFLPVPFFGPFVPADSTVPCVSLSLLLCFPRRWRFYEFIEWSSRFFWCTTTH